MGVGIAEVAEQLFESLLMGVGIAIQTEEIDRWVGTGRSFGGGEGRGQGGSVGIFVGVEEDVGPVVFVVAVGCESVADKIEGVDILLSCAPVWLQCQYISTRAGLQIKWGFLRGHFETLLSFNW